MLRAADANGRGHECVFQTKRHFHGEAIPTHRIDEKRKVGSVLLNRADRDDDRRAP